MCQAKPLPRCSSHAPGLVQVSEHKYQQAKEASDKQRARVEALVAAARSKGFSEEEIESATAPALSRLNAARGRMRQYVDESNERLRDIWEAELHYDATKVGFKILTSNASLKNREPRSENAIILREWHKKLRSTQGQDGKSIFDKDGDTWMRNAVLEEEYTIAARKYKEQAFQYTTLNGEMRKLKQQFENLSQKTDKKNEDFKELDRIRKTANAMREQQSKIHYAMIVERAKKNLIDNSLTAEFKTSLESAAK